MELKRSNVIFDAINHTYMLDGKKLSGITKLMSVKLFPDKYKDVPESIIEKAREKGSMIHDQIHMAVEGFLPSEPTEEYNAIKDILDKFIESEFIVSDDKMYASAIDLIDNDLNLYDIKTTYKLDKEYVSWQLSIYAYLFKKQTGIDAKKLFAIHLKGDKMKIVEVNRIADNLIEDLLYGTLDMVDNALVEKCREFESYIKQTETKLKTLQENYDTFKEMLMEEMKNRGIKSIDNDQFKITLKEASTRTQFDSKKYKEEHADEYSKYTKEVKVKESLIIKFKTND